jgi:hypothetical protein
MPYSDYLPDINFSSYPFYLGIGLLVIVLAVAFGIGLYFFIRWMKFNRQITILEDVQGADDLEPVGKDKAMLVKVGKGGTELLYLKRRKVYRGAYGKRMGKNKYYFAIGSDGIWYNITLGSLERGMNKVGIRPTSVNMRYQNESLMELIKQRFEQQNFFQKYGQLLVNMVFFVIVAIMFWLYFDKLIDTASTMQEVSKTLKEAGDALKEAIGGLDRLRSTGGVIPV